MSSFLGECSVMKEISKTEEAIKICYERVRSLEKKIEYDISAEKKDSIKKELSEVRKLLKTNEEQLSCLHRHNRKSFAIVAALCFMCFTIYALYILIYGQDL
ncbi:CCDC-167 domain containing protein [Asbolus verrucosus]|uniref:Coiled-coil domain-containing protein 167 n=1 Tax=Asbolus verrucosus TaxID=1661398 RepID=A0A482W0C7_ASBVE|nr:CCDC-167 domain containing protein [Asbolus verrucosus]